MTGDAFEKLVDIMAMLRSPEGCPWDREQTHDSLKPYLLEEAYEVLETLDKKDYEGLKEELGDLMLQSIFHAQVASENNEFNIWDVLNTINEKLIRRHPHVFGDIEIKTADEQKIHWEKLKKKEGKQSVLDGVPVSAPSLLRASRIQQKAATVGFDWGDIEPVWRKIDEEFVELRHALEATDHEAIHEEFGDLLFAMVNLSRFIKVNPEDSLRCAVQKFIDRFQKLEDIFRQEGKNLHDVSLEEMDRIWEQIKHKKS